MTVIRRHRKRKKTLPKMKGKQKIKHRNETLKFMSIIGMMRNRNKTRRKLKLRMRKRQNQKIIKKTIQTEERKKFKRMKRS